MPAMLPPGNPELHNRLLGQFRLYWNVFQFFLKVDETIRDSFSQLGAGFTGTFQKFKQCKNLLHEEPESPAVRTSLGGLELDLRQLRDGLNSRDGLISVDRIRRAMEESERFDEALCNNLVNYHLCKEFKAAGDRDKIDYLITLYFHREHPALVNLDNLETLARQIAVFTGAQRSSDQLIPPELFERYLTLAREVHVLGEFNGLLNQGIITGIREFKQSLGELFFHPSMLARIIVLNALMREKFQLLLNRENRRTEDQIIKLAEVGGEILMANDTPESPSISLLGAKELRDNLTADLQEEYSHNTEKFRQIEQIGTLLDRTFTFYGLGDGISRLGGKPAARVSASAAAPQETPAPRAAQAGRDDDELRKVVAELEMMVRSNATPGSSSTRFKFRDIQMVFSPWETEAFLDVRPGSEMQMRIRQTVRRALGMVYLIQDILHQCQEFSSASLPRGLLLSLEYCLLQAQEHRKKLEDLVVDVVKRGMKLEAFHLVNVQARLTATVASVKPFFQKERTA